MSWEIILLYLWAWNSMHYWQKLYTKVKIFRLVNACIKIYHFWNQGSVFLQTLDHSSVSWDAIGCYNETHPIPHAIFETARLGFIQILHHCSVSWKKTPRYFFYLKPLILSTKIDHRSKIFGLLIGWVKIHQNSSCHIWNCRPAFL